MNFVIKKINGELLHKLTYTPSCKKGLMVIHNLVFLYETNAKYESMIKNSNYVNKGIKFLLFFNEELNYLVYIPKRYCSEFTSGYINDILINSVNIKQISIKCYKR